MKYFLPIIFLLAPLIANASLCDKYYSDFSGRGLDKSKTCSFEWGKEGEKRLAEIVFLKKGCQKFDESPRQDCYVVHTCPDSEKEDRFVSVSLISEDNELNSYCKYTKPELLTVLGSKYESPKSPVKAKINCIKNSVVSITLKSPEGRMKICPIASR